MVDKTIVANYERRISLASMFLGFGWFFLKGENVWAKAESTIKFSLDKEGGKVEFLVPEKYKPHKISNVFELG